MVSVVTLAYLFTVNFKSDTSFDIIWERYIFDRRLRILLMDAIERIEIAIRSDIVYYFTKEHGLFGYLNKEKIPNLNADGMIFQFLMEHLNHGLKRLM